MLYTTLLALVGVGSNLFAAASPLPQVATTPGPVIPDTTSSTNTSSNSEGTPMDTSGTTGTPNTPTDTGSTDTTGTTNSSTTPETTPTTNTTGAYGSQYLLTTTVFNRTAFQNQAYVANGYISQRLPAEGMGYTQIDNTTANEGGQGWPLFGPRVTAAMVAGFYDHQANTTGVNFPEIQGGEQPIALIPTWSGLYVTVGNSSYDVNTPDAAIANWTQQMSIQYGIVSTSLSWTPEGSTSPLDLNYTIFAHRTRPNLGIVRLDVSGLVANSSVSFTDVLDGIGAMRSNFSESGRIQTTNTIYTAVQPNGIYNVTAYEVSGVETYPSVENVSSTSCYAGLSSNDSTVSQCYTIDSPPEKLTIVKYVGIASSDAFNGTEYATALNASSTARTLGYDALLQEHVEAWDQIWDSADIIIPGEDQQELQLVTRASLFHMLTNVRPGNESTGLGDNSIAPAGLTSDSYAGQIFWDAETWMYPGLLALYPDYAESIPDFRFRQLGAAQQNAAQYNVSGVQYAWTNGRYGNCTAVGPCFNYEEHLNNDIALAAYQYYASTQNLTWLREVGYPLMSNVAEFWASYAVLNSTTGKYETFNMTDPDEYANFVDNPAFTNAGIQVIIRKTIELAALLNETVPGNWSSIADNITVLTDPQSGIILESEGFNGTTVVKQADVILLTYPLEYNQSATDALTNLDFSAGVTSPNGPGMTWSIFSINAAQLSPVGCASYTYMIESAQPYSRFPYYQFSEQTNDVYADNGGTNPAYTFLTGHGGFLQTLTHGFTGYRSRVGTLYLDPTLPPQLPEYTIKGFKWGNSSFDMTLTQNETTIIRQTGGSENVTIQIAETNPSAGNFSIAVGQTITIPTRLLNGTLVEGNVAQCANLVTDDMTFNANTSDIVPGQYRAAAIDGANATTWQPLTNETSTMTVDLGSVQNVTRFHFNWGKNPSATVAVSAGLSIDNQSVVAQQNVDISVPYNVTSVTELVVRVGNLTDIILPQPAQVQYINVTISGSFAGDGRGGTLAEFAAM